jgi:hypothetical protein
MRFAKLRLLSAIVVGGTAVLLGGCASAPATTAQTEIDYVKVAQIERAARVFGTQVIWVNYPTKRSDAAK